MKDVHLVWVLWICNHLQTHKVPHCQVRSHEKNRASLVGRVGDMTWAENEIFNTKLDNYIERRHPKWFCHLVMLGSGTTYPVSIQSSGLPSPPKSNAGFIFDMALLICSPTPIWSLISLLSLIPAKEEKKWPPNSCSPTAGVASHQMQLQPPTGAVHNVLSDKPTHPTFKSN